MTIKRFLGWGCLALLAVMPFHAFLVVTLGHIFGHEAIFQIWKELLLAAMTVAAGVFGLRRHKSFRPGLLASLIAAYFILALAVTVAFGHANRSGLIRAFQYDLLFLLAFGLASLAHDKFFKRAGQKILLAATTLVGLFMIAENTVLSKNFLTHFGYGNATIKPYLPYGSLLRFPATMNGPNQLGAFLILPIALTLKLACRQKQVWQFALLGIELATLVLTYSRSAWIGAIVAVAIVGWIEATAGQKRLLVGVLVIFAGLAIWQLPRLHNSRIFFRGGGANTSDTLHLSALKHGVGEVIAHPLGEGLGAAGPASFHSNSPIISENYYLQIGEELGVVGLALFLAIISTLGWQLWQWRTLPGMAGPLMAALAGISVVGLFLHVWADAPTALSFWILAGLTYGESTKRHV